MHIIQGLLRIALLPLNVILACIVFLTGLLITVISREHGQLYIERWRDALRRNKNA